MSGIYIRAGTREIVVHISCILRAQALTLVQYDAHKWQRVRFPGLDGLG